MKIEFDRQWCLRMAQLELESGADIDAGSSPHQTQEGATCVRIANVEPTADSNIAFGRFVRLMRRHRHLTLEKLSEDADVEISELVEIEDDVRHKPEPRTVFQLAQIFNVPTPKLMQVAGLSAPKDSRLVDETIRFAARSDPLVDLNETERAALDAFVSVLSERP